MEHPPAPARTAPTAAPHRASTDDLLTEAVRDNAQWCALFARTHGIIGALDDDAWTSPTRTPPGYPDAVTLRPGVDAEAVLSRIDTASAGCSIKDSYGDLDLAPHGFHELFRATWIWRPSPAPSTPGGPAFSTVTEAEALRAWEWGWGHRSPERRFRPDLLDSPEVSVLAVWDGPEVVAGAIATRFSGGDVVGVSNAFASRGDMGPAWSGIVAWTAEHHPGVPLVGYERGDDLADAVRAGFRELGPLRVWMAAG